MKFIPTNTSFVFEPITTPNKHIHSYFMRSEVVPETVKFQYNENPIQIIILDGFFIVSGTKIEQDVMINSRMNIEKYGSIQRCTDEIYKILKNEKELEKNSPVQLIVSDFIGRSDLILLIDIIINQLGFKAITILPFSLCLSFNLNQSSCCFIYNTGFSFIDDFCLIDTCEIMSDSYRKTRIDDEDFAEEYSRLDYNKQLLEIEGRRFSCDECGQKEDTEEKIVAHINKEHENGTYFEYVKCEDSNKMEAANQKDNNNKVNTANQKDNSNNKVNTENLKNRMRYIFNKEKYEKVSKKIYSVGITNLEGLDCIPIEDSIETVILGAQTFSNLEISKELWITETEWRSLRLRILKEKVLFYI